MASDVVTAPSLVNTVAAAAAAALLLAAACGMHMVSRIRLNPFFKV
jgi:hypothetical protein